MGGDGNLSESLLRYCQTTDLKAPHVTLFEYSRVQCELARKKAALKDIDVVWGDILSLQSKEDDQRLPEGIFDRVAIKSANHEIPEQKQLTLYQNVFKLLQPDGLFCNLGFLFDNPVERDEFREIARCKDSLAELTEAVLNRHFLTRSEFYALLSEAGFTDFESRPIQYYISSSSVAKFYFSKSQDPFDLEFQAAQARARRLRQAGRITFHRDSSMMTIPGEITIARKPAAKPGGVRVFKEYPYDYVRHMKAHQELLNAVVPHLKPSSRVLDLGCGTGLLAERLVDKSVDYLGIDLFADFINICHERLGSEKGFKFAVKDMNSFEASAKSYDHAILMNSLYVEGVDPMRVLPTVYEVLKKGGTAFISGPISRKGFEKALPYIQKQLAVDGKLDMQLWNQVVSANARLLNERAHYWSAEGLVALLREAGFEKFNYLSNDFYYGNAYLVVAEK
jgi:SAM-dependent methyltransferase